MHSSSVKAHSAQCTLTSVTTVLQSKSISHTLTSIAAVYSSVTMGAVATIFRSNYGRKPFTFVWGTLGNKISKHDPFQRDVGVNNHHHMKISVQRPYHPISPHISFLPLLHCATMCKHVLHVFVYMRALGVKNGAYSDLCRVYHILK